MKLTLWLLYINYEIKNATPELGIWGIESTGNRVLIIDRNFQTYFYAMLKEDANPERVVEEVQSRKSLLVAESSGHVGTSCVSCLISQKAHPSTNVIRQTSFHISSKRVDNVLHEKA